MKKKQAWHALRMEKVEDIVLEHLVRVDEDMFLYTDWSAAMEYAIVDAKAEGVQVHRIPFKVAKQTLDAEMDKHSPLVLDYEADKALEELGICSECQQPYDLCVCSP